MKHTFSGADLMVAKLAGLDTPSGVCYTWWVESSQGAGFALFREPRHTDEDIQAAKTYLRNQRDVVIIQVWHPARSSETK